MAYYTQADPDTYAQWGRPKSPDSYWRKHHRGISSFPRNLHPSKDYPGPRYSFSSPPPPPPPPPPYTGYNASYNASYAPQYDPWASASAYPPPPGQPQLYTYRPQNWPHPSVVPYYPTQPPPSSSFPANYRPPSPPQPPPPPPPVFQDHPAYPNQQPVLTLYINPAFLTTTPVTLSNTPASPRQHAHISLNSVDQQPPHPPKSAWRNVATDNTKKVRFDKGPQLRHPLPSHAPGSLYLRPTSITTQKSPVIIDSHPPTDRVSSPNQIIFSPDRPSPPILKPKPLHELAPVAPQTVLSPPPSSPPLSPRLPLSPSVPSPIPSPQSNVASTTEIVDIPQTTGPPSVSSQATINERHGKFLQQFINKDKLTQASNISDPKLKAFLEDFVNLPKLLELFGSTATTNEDATAVNENIEGQASYNTTKKQLEGAPGEVISPKNGSRNEDDINVEGDPNDSAERIVESIHTINVEHSGMVPEISPSPHKYTIELVRVDDDFVESDDDGDNDADVPEHSQVCDDDVLFRYVSY